MRIGARAGHGNAVRRDSADGEAHPGWRGGIHAESRAGGPAKAAVEVGGGGAAGVIHAIVGPGAMLEDKVAVGRGGSPGIIVRLDLRLRERPVVNGELIHAAGIIRIGGPVAPAQVVVGAAHHIGDRRLAADAQGGSIAIHGHRAVALEHARIVVPFVVDEGAGGARRASRGRAIINLEGQVARSARAVCQDIVIRWASAEVHEPGIVLAGGRVSPKLNRHSAAETVRKTRNHHMVIRAVEAHAGAPRHRARLPQRHAAGVRPVAGGLRQAIKHPDAVIPLAVGQRRAQFASGAGAGYELGIRHRGGKIHRGGDLHAVIALRVRVGVGVRPLQRRGVVGAPFIPRETGVGRRRVGVQHFVGAVAGAAAVTAKPAVVVVAFLGIVIEHADAGVIRLRVAVGDGVILIPGRRA
ncbi:MAG: hypothetical protein BWX68_02733 [Verrucomicrobia bacterium ADurb.Bin063]|nr:MAG: hypothetical protein BWX68_02733 [Verrucomicrobia bacterium ADurb.Bin063]